VVFGLSTHNILLLFLLKIVASVAFVFVAPIVVVISVVVVVVAAVNGSDLHNMANSMQQFPVRWHPKYLPSFVCQFGLCSRLIHM